MSSDTYLRINLIYILLIYFFIEIYYDINNQYYYFYKKFCISISIFINYSQFLKFKYLN